MCDHEGQPCPGRACRCVCMNCTFPEADEEDEEPHDHACWEISERFPAFCASNANHDGRCKKETCYLRDGEEASRPKGGWRPR